ncbi:MAG: phage tail protein [Bacteroidaceae bacterium]|nr:phage tail protein [Bacteroidaceae bacterium]
MIREAPENVWPLRGFYFAVKIADLPEAKFGEISGLDVGQEIEYHQGNAPAFPTIKMPGMRKYGRVTLHRGVFKMDDKFLKWFNKIKMNIIERQPITIMLLNESGAPTMVWILKNAWPNKITGTDMKSEGNEVAVETLEIVHEGITIENG